MPVLKDGLSAVFEPRRVALVGASDQPGKTGELFWRNLASFPGEVVPVTSSAETVAGHKAYPTLRDVEGEIDLAVVVVPAAGVPAVIRDASAKGVSAAIVISGGFAEAGPGGIRLNDELVAAARAGGVRIVGPNCFGVQNCDLPLNASMAAGTPRAGGGISLVTQSGAYGMAIHSLGLDEQIGFAKVYAAGNKADIGDAELLRYLADDGASRTLCFFLESLPDGRAFFEAACRATPRKPVIVAKTGRSVDGVRAARSHTAGLAGSERVWRAAFEQAGVILVRSGLEMMDVARALDSQPPPAGRRVAVITNSGGTGVELTDLLADEGLEVPELSVKLQDELRLLLPPLASPSNPVDLTPVWSRFAELYPLLVDRLARSGEVDAVVPVLLQRSASDERVAVGIRDAVDRLRADGVRVPVYVCWVAPRTSRPNADLLQEGGVPCFEWPERTARALGHAARYGEARSRSPASAGAVGPAAGSVAASAGSALGSASDVSALAGVPGSGLAPGWLGIDAAAEVLAGTGIQTVAGRICGTAAEAAVAADDLGYPVVVKAVHPTLLHKTEAGGVRLDLGDPLAVQAAAAELLTLAPGAALLVQPQVAGTEVIVGGLRDPQFGPTVLVGLGGIFVEALDDIALGLAPLNHEAARGLLGKLRGYPLLAGARGAEPVDLDALAAVITAVGDLLVTRPEIAELDLNPVLAAPDGCVAVDWRILVENPPGQDQERPQDSPRHAGETRRRPS
jgi:acyl-CoA synthetase (NDP forming)